ncbi:MAG: DUF4968 domain-containing protein [Bacteroidales bacterium]|nr:DUF4968 domain-containing protein [Bacteroidales bacterium]
MKKILCCLAGALLLAGCGKVEKGVRIPTSEGTLIVTPMADNAIRVQMMGRPTHNVEELVFTESVAAPEYSKTEDGASIVIETSGIRAVFDKATECISFYDASGRLLMQEQQGGRRMNDTEIMGDPTYEVSQSFVMQPGDHQFGTGQFQDGQLDIFGLSRRLTQNNSQIVSPMIISSKGYGILWHNYGRTDFNPCDKSFTIAVRPSEDVQPTQAAASPMARAMRPPKVYEGEFSVDEDGRYALLLCVGKEGVRSGHSIEVDGVKIFSDDNSWVPTVATYADLSAGTHKLVATGSNDDTVELQLRKVDNTTTFSSPVAQNLDYTVFAGSADEVIASYRTLTGPVPQMPDWAFGFIQCRERYDTQTELLENAHGYKDRDIPVDLFVQDWKYWGDTGWNSMEFDKVKYPDAQGMVDEIHDLGYKLMISVWSRVEHGTPLGDDIEEKGYFIPGTEWIDYFNPEASEYYWEHFRASLVVMGFDGWWFDATEPDNDYELLDRRVADNTIPGAVYRNVYPLVGNRTMYEGFKTYYAPDNMPVVLTRSAFAGSQRYGVITWSGDISGGWDCLRRQIIGGLGQMSTGLPWWTYDAGGFQRPADQYTSSAYQEAMLRWIETSVFLPFMRVHGSGSRTEPWNYSDETYRIYVDNINLRYQLRPYITEQARRVSEEGYTLMRPLVFDFPDDEEALCQSTEYMFGPDYLVCPVTEPGVRTWDVYLPANDGGWKDFRSGEVYDGGQHVSVQVNLDAIPVFIRQ